ncbi:outer membrane protein assembly factor BamC [Thorsellia anophelis]|uniref:NlpB/DapX lipoprotein n=1 Tax=Thorsellia anophelis DSM 18579 TaxID=1123402 RepID=A0A1I0CJN1_9GAMM|nr:outer membrane protein assembly factor BamC [Thorsellia anophelis]SET19379.1 NlpB/DapX lipoprotein [Thorsellia anophelis DSM 18579]
MNKASLKILSIAASVLVITGCSKDTSFTKEVRGPDDYLYVTSPKELNIPPSIALPPQNGDFEIALPAKDGNLGRDIDITPPNVGLTSVEDQEQTKFAQDELSSGLYQESITVSSGTDETSLPIVLLNTNFSQAWGILTTNLSQLGFEILEQNQTNGSMKVEYKGLSSSELQSLGAVEFLLPEGVYLIQVGDLNTQTSIQLRNEKNTYLTQSQNDALSELLQKIVNN